MHARTPGTILSPGRQGRVRKGRGRVDREEKSRKGKDRKEMKEIEIKRRGGKREKCHLKKQ